MNFPKISVVTTSYNQGKFLEEAIKSVLNQRYPNLEYIVIDGGSRDGSVEIIKKYEKEITYWVSEKDKGQSHAINKGFAKSTKDIMAWLNSDDILLPGTLELVAAEFVKKPKIDIIYGDRYVIDEKSVKKAFYLARPVKGPSLYYFNTIPQETVFWRRRIWEKLKYGLDENMLFALDYDLFVRFALCGARFRHIPKFIGACRYHADTKTSKMQGIYEKDIHFIRKKYFNNPRMREGVGELSHPRKIWWFFRKGLLFWLFWTRIKAYFLSKRLRLPAREMLWN